MEYTIADKKQKIVDIEPGFADLEKAFEERKNAYEKQKKDIVGMWSLAPTVGGTIHTQVPWLLWKHGSLCSLFCCHDNTRAHHLQELCST